MFTKAIVRPPGSNFAAGLTTVDLGRPDYLVTIEQHSSYCAALVRCGLELLRLEVDENFPDGTFVEDTAVVTDSLAVITNPGAASRKAEVVAISKALTNFYPTLLNISAPATLDGGDVCEAGTHFFIGISERTNEVGAAALASMLAVSGYSSSFVDIRGVPGILHLKSGIAYLSRGHLLVIDSLHQRQEFRGYELLRVPLGEDYAANCVEINDHVLIAAGFPQTERMINERGYHTMALEMSEFQKMDGGLSCLSLRF